MSLDKAILDTLKLNFVPRNVKDERKKICDSCDENKNGFCAGCKCLIAWKVNMKEERCPLDTPKWTEYVTVKTVKSDKDEH